MTALSKSQSRIFAAPVEEEVKGIVAILNSDGGEGKAASIRRTLSADMSSRKWLEQNGMKKVVSSVELRKLPVSDSSSSEGEEEDGKFRWGEDVWREEEKKPAAMADVWSSILSCEKRNDGPPAEYVHPLVKRSSSCLSEKSLEICTESLGSETGSDCFEVYCGLEEGKDEEVRVLEEELKEENQFGDFLCGGARYKKSPAARPSPPPIHSICGGYGASIHMNSHRENGRLVVEAVSVPPRNLFQARRRDGRLVLSLMRTPVEAEMAGGSDGVGEIDNDIEESLVEDGGGDDGYVEDEEAEEVEFESLSSVQESGGKTTKSLAIGNRNPIPDDAAVAEEEITIAQSLPPRRRVSRLIPSPPTGAAASFKEYEYICRSMSAVSGGGYINPINKRRFNDSVNGVEGDEKKAEYVGPYLRGCKEGRRSLLSWEPYCIAT